MNVNIRLIMRLIYATTALNFYTSSAHAQGQQLWLDYQVDLPFANAYLFEVSSSYQTVIDADRKWRSFNVTPTFEWQWLTNLDVLVNVPISRTVQSSDYTSFELDPSLGARLHISQNRRITSSLIFKAEHRYFQNIETSAWEHSNRMRLKGEAFVALNGPNLFQDNLWWAIVDYEEFFVLDEQLDERFSNRRRGRIGVGYRLNYRNRFEMIYTFQSSRDNIGGDFTSLDNVLQLRYKMYLNPSKPLPTTTETP